MIRFEDVTKAYANDVVALRDVSLEISKGEFVFLIGPSGSDEPTGNLDPGTTVGIMKLLDRINRTGTTVVMATHDQRIVDAMRRRVLELDRGNLVRDQARGIYDVGT